MTTWIPGMRTKNKIRIVSVHLDGYVEGYSESEGYIMEVGVDAEPDESDPATIGCLLWLVQQAGGDVPAHPDAESLVAALESMNDD